MGDQVGGHASTWKGWAGFAVGLLIGAAIGVALVLAAPVVVGVATACVLASAVTGGIALAATGALVVGRFAHTFDAPAVKGGAPCGTITKGLDTVTIETMQAARQSDPVSHGSAQMRQGSATVLMKKLPASRNDDLSSCTGKVIKPATYTFIGGPPADNGKSSSASALDTWFGYAAFTAKWFGLASMALGVAGGALAGAFVVTTAKMAAIWAGSTLLLTPTLAKLGDMQDRAEGHGGTEPVQSLGATIEDNAVDQWDGLKAFFGDDADAKARAAKASADARADAGDPAAHRWKDFDSGMSSFITVGLVEGMGKLGKMFGKSPAKTGEEIATPPVDPTTPDAPPPDVTITPPEEECTTCKGGGEPVAPEPPADEETSPPTPRRPASPPPEDPAPTPPEDDAETSQETEEEEETEPAGDAADPPKDAGGDEPPLETPKTPDPEPPPPKCPTCDAAEEVPPATKLVEETKATNLKDVFSQEDADPSIVDKSPVVYRGDSRPPAEVKLANGFAGKNPSNKISAADHLLVKRPPSQWVSATKDSYVGSQYARDPFPVGQPARNPYQLLQRGGTVYQIGKTGGVDVDAALGNSDLGNQEVMFSEPIQWSDVHSYADVPAVINADGSPALNADGTHVDPDAPLQWTKNPDYTGPKLPGDP